MVEFLCSKGHVSSTKMMTIASPLTLTFYCVLYTCVNSVYILFDLHHFELAKVPSLLISLISFMSNTECCPRISSTALLTVPLPTRPNKRTSAYTDM